MRKYTILIILMLMISADGWLQAQTIAMRVPDTTIVSGITFDLPVYADSSLTGKNVTSYMLQLTFNQAYIQFVTVITDGTISAGCGNPVVNTSVPGKITLAGAGTDYLTGKGKFIYIRFRALKPGASGVSFTTTEYNYFNEGSPVMSLDYGYISISTPPYITVSPDEGIITKGEQLDFNVSGGATPYQWFVTNPAVASIDVTGLLTGTETGVTKVVAEDNNGIRDTTDIIEIRAMRLSIPTGLTQWQGADIDIPVNTTDLSGLDIISANISISYYQNILTPVGIVQTGTLLASYPAPEFNSAIPGKLSVAFAGSSALTGSGTLFYIRFHVSAQNTGSTPISFDNGIFNETLLPTFTSGYFSTTNLPVLTISPDNGFMVAGETKQFTVTGGAIQPVTWSVSNTSAATIDQTGLMTANVSSVVVVTVVDSVGARDNSGNFQIYDTRINMPDTSACMSNPVFDYPVFIDALPGGESAFSVQATVTFDTAYLAFTDVETAGTLTQGWTFAKNLTGKQIVFAGSGSSSFSDGGVMAMVKFNLKPNFTAGKNASVVLSNVTLNEGVPYPLIDGNGNISIAGTGTAGTISGTSSVCQGQSNVAYSIPVISNATGYAWSVPSGANIVSGVNTNSITVNYTAAAISGIISVYGTNSCGNGIASPDYTVTVNPLPGDAGTISGEVTVCQGVNAVTYSVPEITDASTYIWTIPAGATGSSITNSIDVVFGAAAVSGDITVKGRNSCGDGTTSVISVTVNSLPADAGPISGSTTICRGEDAVNYTVPVIDGADSYIWTLPTGATGTSTTNSIDIVFGTPALSGDITVKGNNSCGDGAESVLAVTVSSIPADAGVITGDAIVCQSENSVTYSVTEISGADSYIWTFPDGATGTSTTNSIDVVFEITSVSGDITVKGQSSCGEGAASTLSVTVNPLPAEAGTISGLTTICRGEDAVTYSVPEIAGADSYIWTLPTGATGSGTTNSIDIVFGTPALSGDITVKGNNSCGDGTESVLAVIVSSIPADAGVITGDAIVCQSENSVTYSTPEISGADSYIWTLPDGAIGTSTTNSIDVVFGTLSVSGIITVKGNSSCGDGASSSLSVTINPLPAEAGTISGNTTICQGEDAVTFTVPVIDGADSYLWTLPAGATGSGTTNSIDVVFGTSAVSGDIKVKGLNSCGYGAESVLAVIVSSLPADAGVISGTATLCQGVNAVNYTVPVIAGADSYIWTLPAGATGTSLTNSIDVVFGTSSVSGDITVKGENSCGEGIPSVLAVTVSSLPGEAGTISGKSTVTPGENGVYYSIPEIPGAATYIWNLPAGATGTSSTYGINVDFAVNAVSGDITVRGQNSCGEGTASLLAVTISFLPGDAGTITGNTTVCKGETDVNYTVPEIDGAASYIWSLPAGTTGTSITNSIDVDFGAAAVTGEITVKGHNTYGDGVPSALEIRVSSIPENAGTISGNTTICLGETDVNYSITEIPGATSYIWSLPTGATGNSITNSIVVDFGTLAVTGEITVKGENSCGEGAASVLTVTIRSLPVSAGAISGNTTVCQGENSVTYTVPSIAGADSYIWTLPSGANGTSTTNSISVDFGPSAASGTIRVKGHNSCGDGFPSVLSVVVNTRPPKPSISRIENVLHSDAAIGNQWFKQNGLINGATSQDYTLLTNGFYHVVVTINGCSSEPSDTLNIISIGIEDIVADKDVKVYPNPVSDKLIIEIESGINQRKFEILNSSGQIVYKGNVADRAVVPTATISQGVYLLKIENDKTFILKKIIKK